MLAILYVQMWNIPGRFLGPLVDVHSRDVRRKACPMGSTNQTDRQTDWTDYRPTGYRIAPQVKIATTPPHSPWTSCRRVARWASAWWGSSPCSRKRAAGGPGGAACRWSGRGTSWWPARRPCPRSRAQNTPEGSCEEFTNEQTEGEFKLAPQ